MLKKFAPPEVVDKVIKSAAAARAGGKRPQSASGPAKKG